MSDLIKLILAVIGLTDILFVQKIAKPIRELVGIDHFNAIPSVYPKTFWGDVFSCFRCLSVWVTLCLLTVKVVYKPLYTILVLLFGGSWGAYLFYDLLGKIRTKYQI